MKNEWSALCREFSDMPDNSTASRKAFCADHNINDNSFRRELGKYKKLNNSSDQPKGDQKPTASSTTKQKTPTNNKKPAAQKHQSTEKIAGSDESRARKPKKSKTPRVIPERKEKFKPDHDVNNYDENGRRSFKKGNQAALIHGAHSSKFFLNDTERDFSSASMGDVLDNMVQRIMSMNNIRTEKLRSLEKYYDEGKAYLREVMDVATGDMVKVPMSFEEAKESIEYEGLELLEKYKGRYFAGKEKSHKMEMDLYNLKVNSTKRTVEITAQILHERTLKDYTAQYTCNLFYQNGIEPPVLLVKEAEHEIRTAEPEIGDNENGATKEQLEERRQIAMDNRANRDQWLSNRRKEMDDLLAGNEGMGDMLVTDSDE